MRKNIPELLAAYKGKIFTDEDENEVGLHLEKGASEKRIAAFEKKYNLLPASYRELLKFSDGVDLFGAEILPLDAIEYYDVYDAFSIHNWGNGDFDLITAGGKIVFLDNEHEELIPVSNSLHAWLEEVAGEIKARGALAHPEDYLDLKRNGLYKKVRTAQLKLKAKKKTSQPASPEKTKKAPADPRQLLKFLDEPPYRALEDDIAKRCGIAVDREDLSFLAEMACDEIDQSEFSLDEIRAFCASDKKQLGDFTSAFLKNDRGETFGGGFLLLYAIYLLYMKKGSDENFLAFLRQKSIPKVETFMKQLKKEVAPLYPRKKKAPVKPGQVLDLLDDPAFRLVEEDIAKHCGVKIERELLSAIVKIKCKDIDSSGFSLEEIRSFCFSEQKLLRDFAARFLVKNRGSIFPPGFTTLYAIYLLYMKNGSDEDFLAFLRQRSIPKVETFMKQLTKIYSGISH